MGHRLLTRHRKDRFAVSERGPPRTTPPRGFQGETVVNSLGRTDTERHNHVGSEPRSSRLRRNTGSLNAPASSSSEPANVTSRGEGASRTWLRESRDGAVTPDSWGGRGVVTGGPGRKTGGVRGRSGGGDERSRGERFGGRRRASGFPEDVGGGEGARREGPGGAPRSEARWFQTPALRTGREWLRDFKGLRVRS